jgi:uncharacterized protein YigE (DUF2233 family)
MREGENPIQYDCSLKPTEMFVNQRQSSIGSVPLRTPPPFLSLFCRASGRFFLSTQKIGISTSDVQRHFSENSVCGDFVNVTY